jgi:hypothetical protein
MATIDEVKKELDALKQKLVEIDMKLTTLQQDSARVRHHMDLVEKVYEKAAQPVHYMMDRFNYLLYHHNPFME